MLFFVRFDIHQPEDMPIEEFFAILHEEAKVGLKAKESGAVHALWKVSGQRTVLMVADFPDHDVLDKALTRIPMIQKLGGSVDTEVLPIRSYESYAEDLRKAVEARQGG